MRKRQEVEQFLKKRPTAEPEIKIVIELLLDLRDQNAALLAVYEAQVGNERDAILKAAGISGGSL